jgi:hypothetical protein
LQYSQAPAGLQPSEREIPARSALRPRRRRIFSSFCGRLC